MVKVTLTFKYYHCEHPMINCGIYETNNQTCNLKKIEKMKK